jgi:hypothetical protein
MTSTWRRGVFERGKAWAPTRLLYRGSSALTARWMDRNTKPLLDQLRLTNQYTNWVDRAACHEQLVAAGQGTLDAVDHLRISTSELLADHQDWAGFQMDCDATMWAEDAGFHSRGNLKMELLRAKVARTSLLNLIAESLGEADEGHDPQRSVRAAEANAQGSAN